MKPLQGAHGCALWKEIRMRGDSVFTIHLF